MGKAGRILVDERNAFFHDNCRFYLGKPCGHQESVNDSVRVATLCSHLPPYSSPLPFSSTAVSHSSRPSSSFVHCFALLLCIHLLVVVLIFFSFPPGRSSSSVPFSHSPSPSLTLAVRYDDVHIQTVFQSNV